MTDSSLPFFGALSCRLIGWLAGAVLAISGGSARSQSVWELTPYRIEVLVAVEPAAEVTSLLVRDLLEGLAHRADAQVGAPWKLTAKTAPSPWQHRPLNSPAGLDADTLPDAWLGSEADKLILLTVASDAGTYLVTAQEFDLQTRLLGASVSLRVTQRALLNDEAFRAVHVAFSPLARILDASADTATLQLRAAALPCRESQLLAVGPGDVFRPVLRFNDQQGGARRIETAPWTFLSVQEVAGARVEARIHTGVRSPLSGRRRGRVEQLAIRVGRPTTSTRLQLASRYDPKGPLVDYQVFAHGPDSKTTTLLGRTGCDGALDIPPGPQALRILLVTGGAEPLARLPLVPGLATALTAEIAPDEQRLEVEGLITGLQEEYVDYVAQRQVLIARIEARIDNRQLDEAQQLLDQLRQLAPKLQFVQRIEKHKQRFVAADPLVQHKIDKLLDDTLRVVGRLDDRRQADHLQTQLDKQKQAAPQEP